MKLKCQPSNERTWRKYNSGLLDVDLAPRINSLSKEKKVKVLVLQGARCSRASRGLWRRRSGTVPAREDPRSSSRRPRSPSPPTSSANSQVYSTFILSEKTLFSYCWLVNCALVPDEPILRVNYLRGLTARGPVSSTTTNFLQPRLCHYLQPRRPLIINSSNFFSEFLRHSRQLFAGLEIRKSFGNWIIGNYQRWSWCKHWLIKIKCQQRGIPFIIYHFLSKGISTLHCASCVNTLWI